MKGSLLDDLANAVADWSGRERAGRATVSRIESVLGLLAICPLLPLECLKLEACRYCFRQLRGSKPPEFLREAWLAEIRCWQHFVDIGAGLDALPDLPPPNPLEGKSGLEIHHFPLPRPLY